MKRDDLVLPRKINASDPVTFGRTAEEHSGDTFDILLKMKGQLNKLTADMSVMQARLVGQQFQIVRLSADANSNVVALANVPDLSFALKANATYAFFYGLHYGAANTTTGVRLAVNYSGTCSIRATLVGGANLTTFHSLSVGTLDQQMGTANSSGGGLTVGNLLYGIINTTLAGTMFLRFASGVAGVNAFIGANSFGMLVQQ